MTAKTAPPIVERRYLLPFLLVASLFLSWALAAALNDVLIRQFQKALDLTRGESSFIQLAFYIGYFCAALPAGLLIRRLGYKSVMIIGLILYACGAFLFYPAAEIRKFGVFLSALYTIAFGLAFLETSANPYVSILGDPKTGSARLNLAQSFYGIGAILGPFIGGAFIFSGVEHSKAQLAAMSSSVLLAYRMAEARTVQLPYLLVGLAMCALAVVIGITRFPHIERPARTAVDPSTGIFSILRHRRLRQAIIAQFFYVGAQVGIWSFFIDFTKDAMPALSERTAAYMLSGSLGLLMVGRASGALVQRYVDPAKLLAAYAAINIGLCAIASLAGGAVAVAAIWLTSFFMSIMFPTIFALGVEGLGDRTELGSSFLIMSIIGGAVVPPSIGIIADRLTGIHLAMMVPAMCFVVCLTFAFRVLRSGNTA
jgi:FHS family L-fucose permease-like MFS transporter